MSIRRTTPPPSVERRRKPEDVRRDALEVGRRLLIARGPSALTLKAVGAELGMSHANLIHHFGSADAYQAALKDEMVLDLTRRATTLVAEAGDAPPDTAAIVNQVFDAYDAGGIAILMAWSVLTGASGDKIGLGEATQALVAALEPRMPDENAAARARHIVSLVTMLALAEGLIGASLAEAVGARRDAMRALTITLVEQLTGGKLA
jgi:TetR/AcrR family transcriptional regulator, repressor for neighboring sulfatase